MASAAAAPVGFSPLVPAPDVGFWRELTRLKLDVLRLDSSPIPVSASYEVPASKGVPEKCFLLHESFAAAEKLPGILMRGHLQNFNLVEEFREFLKSGERAARIAEVLERVRADIQSGAALEDPAALRPFLAVSFADLKKYHFSYTVAFPAFNVAWETYSAPVAAEAAGVSRSELVTLSSLLHQEPSMVAAGALLLVGSAAAWSPRPLGDLGSCADRKEDELMLVFLDSSSGDAVAGTPLRNLLLLVASKRPGRLRVLAFRDQHLHARSSEAPVHSRVFYVVADGEKAAAALESPVPPKVQLAQWAKIQNFVLSAFLDSKQVAADAVDLNIKLMKWRLMPELEPRKMQDLRFLLLGSGTLGCSVARALMGWGVRRMTFVDSGKVSFSNPVRQSLFTHRDAVEERPKALAAKEAVEAVMPDAEVRAVQMDIPMPGHPHSEAAALRQSCEQLQALVEEHDVVCMLTDSRESRWLPSLLVAASQRSDNPRLGLTVALGFDSFLVSRQSFRAHRSACYFCNDVSAPADSLANRTLDQQCTVTRPGLSGLSSSTAVELVAALTQHPQGFAAPAASADSPLGLVTDQIRGFLHDYRLVMNETEPSNVCPCCSEPIMEAFAKEGFGFVEQIIKDSTKLEELSGMAALKASVNKLDVMSFDDFDDF